MRQHRKHSFIILLIILLIFGALFFWHQIRQHIAARESAAVDSVPNVVEMTKVKSQVWYPQIQAVGTVVAQQGIVLTTQIAGIVKSIDFKSGQFIEQGKPIVQLDPSVLQATANQSKANYELSVADYQRNKRLYKTRAISLSALQKAEATMKANRAQMDEDQAKLAQSTIKTPFSGNIGLRQISLGEYLAIGAPIANLQSIDPVYVDFNVPEAYMQQISVGDKVQITSASLSGQTYTGQVIAMDSTLDPDTRMLNIRASVPNKNKRLVPGMFARVNVIIPTKQNVLTVPQMAVQYSPFGDTVFVVQNGKAVQRYVNLGEQRGAEIAINKGLSAGETIISVGGNKLQNGANVITQQALVAAQQRKVEKEVTKNASSSSTTKH